MQKKFFIFLGILLIVVIAVFFIRQQPSPEIEKVENTDFVNEKSDLIAVDNPQGNQIVSSPLEVSGKARGTWFFEANFPVKLYDSSGKEITVGIAQAQGEWMTEEFVPFTATLIFEIPLADKGELVFEKSNPSDLPENADSLRMPVRFR